ncbi:nitroreductase family protein [Fontibacillus sp. BL9]|uniref:nitroreductase family protein n=1 Tax=Fontibacillus sp. BL9 TaxID=3389971 RepID=UPI00397A1F41
MSITSLLEKSYRCRPGRFEREKVEPELILQLLETAVWAPNDGLREPWRFLFMTGEQRREALPLHREAPAHLVVIADAVGDAHKQEEDLAAVFCLIQNMRLLGLEHNIGMLICMDDWIHDSPLRQRLGIRDHERIAAILDIGYTEIGDTAKEIQTSSLRISEC